MGGHESRANPKALHAYVAAAEPAEGSSGMGIVFVNAEGHVLRRVGRMLSPEATKDLAAFRGILYALWNSRRLGSRSVIVHSDNPDVVDQINGVRDVDPALVGPYLEVRALLNAYRGARVEAGDTIWGQEAAAIAKAARERDSSDIVEDLPLWGGLQLRERSSA